MDTRDIISTLNKLIETCKDGEQGFRTCAEDLDDQQLKQTFALRADQCAQAAVQLQELVRSMGGVAETSSSVAGTLHRRWVDIKSAVTGKDTLSVLNECERGEDIALADYRAALEKDLPDNIRAVIETQYQGVQKNHAQVKALRDAAQTAANLAKRP